MDKIKMIKILSFLVIGVLVLFAFNDDFPFDKSKIQGYDGKEDIQKIVAPIINQVWVASKKLSKEELEKLVLSKYKFQVIGYEKVYGLLIQFDETNKHQLEILEELKSDKNIDNVYNRVYEGSKGFNLMPSF
jgi:hypothetical protein